MVSGIPLVLGLRPSMQDPYVYVVCWPLVSSHGEQDKLSYACTHIHIYIYIQSQVFLPPLRALPFLGILEHPTLQFSSTEPVPISFLRGRCMYCTFPFKGSRLRAQVAARGSDTCCSFPGPGVQSSRGSCRVAAKELKPSYHIPQNLVICRTSLLR